MGSRNPQTLDYADSRNLRGDDARIERLGRQQGLIGDSSPLPIRARSGSIESKGYDKIATTQEKQQAGQGAGGKGKRCTKGKSCGAACIFYEKDCILELPETVNTGISQVRDMLQRRVSAGAITEEEAAGHMQRLLAGGTKDADPDAINLTKQRAKEISDAIETLKAEHTKNGVLDEKAFDKSLSHVIDTITPGVAIPRTKDTPLTVEDFEGMYANRATWTKLSDLQKEVIARNKEGKPMSAEELQSKLRPIVEPYRQQVSDSQVALAKALMPETERDYFKKAGALDEKDTGGRFGPNARGDALPVRHGALKEQTAEEANNRLNLLTRVYLEHGGRDLITGRKVPITLSDLEHGIAEAHAGRAAEQGLNYSPLKTSLNVGRGNKDHVEYFGKLLKKVDFDADGKVTPESRAKIQAALDKAAAKSGLKREIVSASKSAKTAADLREILNKIESIPDQKMQEKLFNKLVSNFLTAYGGVKVAETARAGLQAHGRGEQPWYWYGDKMAGGGATARRIAEKMENLLAAGQADKAMQLANIMQNASSFIKGYVTDNVSPNTERKGKPTIIMGGDKTREVGQAVMAAREQILNQIEAL